MQENKALNVLLLIAKVLILLILFLSLVYFSTVLIDSYIDSLSYVPEQNTVSIDPYPLAFALVFVLSLVTNGAAALLSLLGLILSLLYKGAQNRKANIRTFSVLLASPFAIQLIYFLVGIFTGVLF